MPPITVLAGDVSVGDQLPELLVEVTASHVVLGSLAARDWRPMHHDFKFATERNGVRDIFLNTPNQAAWIERFITDWTGPFGRLGRLKFRMRSSVFPGDSMRFSGTVTASRTDDYACNWVDIDVTVSVVESDGSRLATTCEVSCALPASADDNPWLRRGKNWAP